MAAFLFAFPTLLLLALTAYIFGRTQAPARYDVWDAVRQCPTCGRLMIPSGEGMTPICWPCNRSTPSHALPPTRAEARR